MKYFKLIFFIFIVYKVPWRSLVSSIIIIYKGRGYIILYRGPHVGSGKFETCHCGYTKCQIINPSTIDMYKEKERI
jgi:hypothetical protein